MTRIPATSELQSPPPSLGDRNSLNELDLDGFLKLMIAELKNQDPLSPLENHEILAQISQIRAVGATDKLSQTLDSVLLGQNIASATNLIGAEIEGISDTSERVSGVVNRVTVSGGQPRLHLDLEATASPSIETGQMAPGTYGYRVVWQAEDGTLEGLDFSGSSAVVTSGSLNNYQSVRLSNLPATSGPKQIYRTDATGTGDYQLIATLTDGNQSSYVDRTADDARSEARLTQGFNERDDLRFRSFEVGLNSVGSIRPPVAPASLTLEDLLSSSVEEPPATDN